MGRWEGSGSTVEELTRWKSTPRRWRVRVTVPMFAMLHLAHSNHTHSQFDVVAPQDI
jgi:hypothetical protein